MQQCFSDVVRNWKPGSSHAPCRQPASEGSDARLMEVVSYIEEHLDDPDLGVDRLQSEFCVSRATLYRMFSEIDGVARFIRRQRLVAARQHLRRHPELAITWLLYEVGFGSERQFQRAFQAEFGISPSEWRERCKAAQVASPYEKACKPSPYSAFATRSAKA
ncbi:AraC family transcriptional regulator [Luteimonas sp. MJ293]|uniref:AraC family transcriptional regulator n=1 Tax=Luteimonas sp. MJ146 TaxID=3129240 RepID=UPI0031B9B3F3